MPFKLSKADSLKLHAALEVADEKREELDLAIETFNSEMEKLFAPVKVLRDGYNESIKIVSDLVSERTDQWQEEHDQKSEKWQNSDRGEAVQSWIEEWRDYGEVLDMLDLEPPEDLVEPEYPETDELPPEQINAGSEQSEAGKPDEKGEDADEDEDDDDADEVAA